MPEKKHRPVATIDDLAAFGERIRQLRLKGAGKADELSLVEAEKELKELSESVQKTLKEVENLMTQAKTLAKSPDQDIEQNKIMEKAKLLNQGLASSFKELEMLSILKLKEATSDETEDFSLALEGFRTSARLDLRHAIKELNTVFSVRERLATLHGELAHWQRIYNLATDAEKAPTFKEGIVRILQKTTQELDTLAQKSSVFDHTQEIESLKKEINKFIEPLKAPIPRGPTAAAVNSPLGAAFAASTTAITALEKGKAEVIAGSTAAPVSAVTKNPNAPNMEELLFERQQKRPADFAAMLAKAEENERKSRAEVAEANAAESSPTQEASSPPNSPKTSTNSSTGSSPEAEKPKPFG